MATEPTSHVTGLHQYSATPPQSLSLPLRASSRAAAQALIWRRYGGVLAARYMDPYLTQGVVGVVER